MSLIDEFYDAVKNNLAALSVQDLKLFVVFSFLAWFIVKQIDYYRKLPPGPWGIPYLGYLPFVRGAPHKWFQQQAARYGDIFSVKMGNNLVCCIGSAELLKELFYRKDSTGRPDTPLNNLMGGFGIILSEGTLWKRQRQFLHDKFRELGVKLCSNPRFEKIVMMEIDELVYDLEKANEKPVDPIMIFGRHIHNIILQLMITQRFEKDDKEFVKFNERVSRGMKLYGAIHIGEHVKPYLKLPGKQAVVREMKQNLDDISQFHLNHVEDRIKQRQVNSMYEASDLLDCYLEKIEKEQNVENSITIFPNTEPEKQIVQVMNDLFSAGMETSRTALLWCLLILIREPHVLQKVREELSKVVQVGQMVTLEHRLMLPYVEAVIFETLRSTSVVPLGTTHVNTTAWKVGKYIIPEGTHIIPLISKMNVDPETYPEPYKFKPERFLKNNQLYVTESFTPFGIGQRMCLGIQLARMELFLFLTNIVNNFDFSIPKGQEVPGLDGVLGVTHAPLPFEMIFKKLTY